MNPAKIERARNRQVTIAATIARLERRIAAGDPKSDRLKERIADLNTHAARAAAVVDSAKKTTKSKSLQ